MATRENLNNLFEAILGTDHVYFQPPASVSMAAPYIKYERDRIQKRYANNSKYVGATRYQVMLIDTSPDSPFLDALLSLPMCEHTRHYAASGLHHDVFDLYFYETPMVPRST